MLAQEGLAGSLSNWPNCCHVLLDISNAFLFSSLTFLSNFNLDIWEINGKSTCMIIYIPFSFASIWHIYLFTVIRCLYIYDCGIFSMGWPQFILTSFYNDFVSCYSFDLVFFSPNTHIASTLILFPFTWDIFSHHSTIISLISWNLLRDETLKIFHLDQEKK